NSQLSLGFITRIEDNYGRKEARGEGWELRTDGWGVARAGKGLLITTEPRPNAASSIKDMGETVQRLNAQREQHVALSDLAQQHGARDSDSQHSEVLRALKEQSDAIRGGVGTEAGFPELRDPHLVLSSAAGIATTTHDSTHITSDQHTVLTTGKDLSIANGGNLFASVRQAFRLFVHKAGMKMVAAAGDIDLQALSNSINLLAKLEITQTANRISITAKEEVVINGGGSYVRLNAGGIEHGTNGGFVAHAASHSLTGPKSLVADIPLTKVRQEGPHVISVLAHSAAGLALKDAMVNFFDTDKEQDHQLAHKELGGGGETSELEAEHNQPYQALVGYEGWNAHFHEEMVEDDEEEEFDIGHDTLEEHPTDGLIIPRNLG
ncbi:type VI secretion system Vgr family protein, partial [Herbaspirillum sp. RTI4]